MIIVYPHMPELRPQDQETKQFIDDIKKSFIVHEIITPKENPYAYHQGLKEIWGKDDMIIIESDVVPTMSQFNDILTCPNLDCSMDNQIMDDKNRGQTRTGFQKKEGNKYRLCNTKTDQFADLGGLAMTKISKLTQSKTKDQFMKENFYWKYLDYNFWEMAKRKIHIHWDQPKHNHAYDYFKPLGEDLYNLDDHVFYGIWGNCLMYKHKDRQDKDEFVVTCTHVLKLPLCCRICTKMLTDRHSKEMLING